MADASPVHLVKGSDEVLLAKGAQELVDRLIGDSDRTEVLSEFGGDDYAMGDVVIAASTVSMFGSRVVVARNASRFGATKAKRRSHPEDADTAEDDGDEESAAAAAQSIEALVRYLADPAPDSTLVLVWEKPVSPQVKRGMKPPKKLLDAIKVAGGEVHDFGLPGGKGRGMWADDQMDAARVRLSPRARQLIFERLGEDLSRLGGILTVLDATFGDASVDADEVEPYLGDAGAVPPWDMTDAIDKGDIARAIANLQRMIGGGRHPLQVMASIQTHVERMLRLDGAGVRDEKVAAELLGIKGSAFPAKKAMQQANKLGSARIARATVLVAAADLDLRGRTAQDPVTVLETLVARLAALSSGRPAARSGGPSRPGARATARR